MREPHGAYRRILLRRAPTVFFPGCLPIRLTRCVRRRRPGLFSAVYTDSDNCLSSPSSNLAEICASLPLTDCVNPSDSVILLLDSACKSAASPPSAAQIVVVSSVARAQTAHRCGMRAVYGVERTWGTPKGEGKQRRANAGALGHCTPSVWATANRGEPHTITVLILAMDVN